MDSVIIKSEDGIPFVPEMYAVPNDKVCTKYSETSLNWTPMAPTFVSGVDMCLYAG
jgi:hypothetical protein